jgi:hypothetical protein
MAKVVNNKQAALQKARARRIELDRDRDLRDQRIEEAAAEVFVLLEQRAAAELVLAETNGSIAEQLRRVLAENVGVEGLALLVDLDVSEVRRLTRGAGEKPGDGAASGATVTSLPAQSGADSAARRAV